MVNEMEEETRKKEILKDILKKLDAGENPETLKAEFRDFLGKVTPLEIAEVEEELVREGISREEIRKLCDLHLKVLNEMQGGRIDVPEGHPLNILLKEHEMLLGFAGELLQIAKDWRGGDEKLTHLLEHLKSSETHYLREENVLFPYLERHGITEPPQVMWMEHDMIRQIKKEIYAIAEPNDVDVMKLQENALKLFETLQSHFYKENNILFPAALRVISEEEWKETRKQFDEIGYCCFTPSSEVEGHPGAKEGKDEIISPKNVISLETGHLHIEELEAILNSLPVDISFVDKEDTVRYYNETKDRIFPRTKAVIGRKVQNCHPQKSVDKVNAILDDFRAGKREKAEFWINLKGRQIHIRYFPVRNKKGEYLGCLEVTQDITEIRKIEGEKRLLDD
ncbi:MAG: DUF438 domain-containing protein [Thermoplasmata archaeon]|nr:DUF438 domain-containing protein [Thermoplasmata archaeon]